MGGKSKQTQRTKGNMRSASSAVASLQLDTLSLTPMNLTFGSSIVANFSDDVINIDGSVDPSFQLILRKLTKKDPTTKIKALKEFTDLVNQSEPDVVNTVLTFFPKIYAQLSTDVDSRVREGAQTALASVVNKVGKSLATILKQVFPAWVCGQYDTHPPAASIAKSCFDKIFPAKKVSDVFAFCESETLEYLTKNLTVLNQQTVCNPKSYTPEECEAKYQRVVISSLRGYASYLDRISADKLEQSREKNLLLIGNDRFWSFQKSKSPGIRAAFFECLSSLLQHASFLLASHEEQMTANVFKSLDESDPTILSHIWTCVILIQANIPNWNRYVNVKKTLLPKLWKVLRSALYPCVIFPNLLPLVSKLDGDSLPEGELHNFYETFFENINYGLRNVQMGRSEMSAVASTYYEMLKFIVMQVSIDKALDIDQKFKFTSALLDDHIIAVIFWCFNADGSFGKHVFNNIASLLGFWSKNSNDNELYQLLLNRFWPELYQVLRNSLETSDNIASITHSHVDLIKNLKSHSQSDKAKSVKIKFNISSEAPLPVTNESKGSSSGEDKVFLDKLNQTVYKLCELYTERISSTLQAEFGVESLEVLVKEYQSEELFTQLAKWKDPKESNICSLYDTFSSWLAEKELRCESIIEIILVLYKYLKPSEKIDLLERWIRVPFVQSWIILRALSYPLCMEPDITKLLKMPDVTDHLAECAKQVTRGVYKENLIILQKCFFQTEDGNILIDSATCEKIIEIVSEPLNDPAKISQLDQCGSFLAQIFPVICSDGAQRDLQRKIFLRLLELSVMREPSDDLSEDTLWEVTTAWQDALSSNDILMDDVLLNSCGAIIREKIENFSMDKMTMKGMDRFTETVSKLIICSVEGSTSKCVIVDKLVETLLNHNNSSTCEYLNNLAETIELMRGSVIVPIKNVADKSDFLDCLDSYIKHNIFNLDVIVKLTCNIKQNVTKKIIAAFDESNLEPGDEIEFSDMQAQMQEEEVTEDYCDLSENLLKEWTQSIFDKFFEVSTAETVLDVLLTNSKQMFEEHENWIIYMQERFKLFMKHQPEFLCDIMREKMFDNANSKGGLHARSLLKLLSTNKYSTDNGKVMLYEDAVIHANQDETIISYVNILQVFAECFDKKTLPITTNLFENYPNLRVKVSASRSLMQNHLDVSDFNELSDRKVVGNALIVMNEILTKQRTEPYLLYNKDVSQESSENVALASEVANFLSDVLTYFPHEIDVKRWDFIRIALSSWVLSVSKSNESFRDNKTKLFISSVFRLNSALSKFIALEKTKSSTELLQNVIDEWEKVFSREVNLVLIKSFVFIIKNLDNESKHQDFFISTLCRYVGFIDFSYTLKSQQVDSTFSLHNLIAFALENLSNKLGEVCVSSATILKQLTKGLISLDQNVLNQRNSEEVAGRHDDESVDNNRWHILDTFRDTLEKYQDVMSDFVEDFNFKTNEMDELSTISSNIAFSYLLLWDLVLNFCAKASPELRSIYARWITVHQFEEVFLVSLFKLMPRDIVKNPDIKSTHMAFSSLDWKQIEDLSIDNDRYSAFLYAESLRTIPAVVRKWWHASNTRKAQLVEKITQNYVSPILCQQDLTALNNKKEKDGKDNMQIKVLMQSREIFATYSLDEAKMELSISLPINYPLGAIKIDSLKHIAGKFQAREIVKQLSIYLTHQNGRLYDGISLWKRNLDRKYEGVEECYVCYSVINQDTCQLPRLTCKTCKKKFHSNCLYKWFTTSNKSTCPLCRNIF